jgi:hypothetical protein
MLIYDQNGFDPTAVIHSKLDVVMSTLGRSAYRVKWGAFNNL